jgi:hypothetical protein
VTGTSLAERQAPDRRCYQRNRTRQRQQTQASEKNKSPHIRSLLHLNGQGSARRTTAGSVRQRTPPSAGQSRCAVRRDSALSRCGASPCDR